MIKLRRVETLALVVGMVAAEAFGSGVGVSYYQAGAPVAAAAYGNCPNGSCAPIAGCSTCQRLGFACVDHASPAPCTPEGGCKPAGPWGWSQPNWRRWPGTSEGGEAPETATEEGSLIPPYEEPAPEDEDKQAPPSIEDVPTAGEEEDSEESSGPAMNRPSRSEMSLPPFPRPTLPSNRPGGDSGPANNDNDAAPPSLPFGYAPPAGGVDSYGPPVPAFEKTIPASLPKAEAGKRDLPPPLPVGFTQNGVAPAPRRLPTTFGRPAVESPVYDTAIQPASAYLPISR